MNRRGFLGMLGIGTGAAAVKQCVTLPDDPGAVGKFAGGKLLEPKQEEFRLDLKRWNSSYCLDVQDGILYDRIRFAPGATIPTRLNFFATPAFQVCPYTNVLKTLRETNMHSAGQLQAPHEFLARRIIFAVHPAASDDDLGMFSSLAYWDFTLLQKNMARGPMLLNGPARADIYDIVEADANDQVKLKDPLPDEVLAASRDQSTLGGILIPCFYTFGVEVTLPDRMPLQTEAEGGRGLDLLIGFVGLEARGVQ